MPFEVMQILGLYWIVLGVTAMWLQSKNIKIEEKLEELKGREK